MKENIMNIDKCPRCGLRHSSVDCPSTMAAFHLSRMDPDYSQPTAPQAPLAGGFTPDELCLPFAEWKELVAARRPHVDAVARRWLAAWSLWDLACSPMDDNERRHIRYGHHLGWLGHSALAGTGQAVVEAITKLVEGLAEQQAMPDDWWKPELERIHAALASGQRSRK